MSDFKKTILDQFEESNRLMREIQATVEATYLKQEILDNDDLLAFLKLKDRIYCSIAREKKLPYFKVGKGYRYALEDVLQWVRERKVID